MTTNRNAISVFLSYAHEDEPLRKELEKHLSLLQRQELISTWHDRRITPGADYTQVIDEHLNSASVILLLISKNFLASDYCYGIEMQRALQRDQAHLARVIPILVRPVDWQGAPFAHLQPLPTNARPITAWRNRDEAFTDIAAGIRRAIEDLSLLTASAPQVALPPIWNIPYPRNSFFISREEVLARLHRQFQAGQTSALSQPQALSGLGGIGKTHTAVEYAYRYHQDYQVVLWGRAESREALISSYVTIAQLLHLSEQQAQDQAIIVQAVKTWLQTHSEWLLILDNADELALLPEFLPPALGGHLLLTTRAWALGRLASRVAIDSLLPHEGALFLLRRAGLLAPDGSLEQASSRDRGLALQITQEFGGLPLALDQAGAYLEEAGCGLSDYLQIYQHHHAQLLKERRGLIDDHPQPVATTWSLSFERVGQKNPIAADLLRLCAFLAPDAIPLAIITEGASYLGPELASVGTDPYLLNQAIEVLLAYSLVHRETSSDTDSLLSMHRLVQAVLKDQMDEPTCEMWAERTVQAMSATFPSVEFTNWSFCERLLPHALVCWDLINQRNLLSREASALLKRMGWYLMERARYAKAEPILRQTMAIRERQLPSIPLDIATSFNDLAELYWRQGRYTEAESLVQHALTIREQQLGIAHPDTATSLNDLAVLYQEQGKYAEAESLMRRALEIYEQQFGPTHSNTAHSLHNLANLYQEQGKYAEAEPLYVRALAIREQQLGAQHPDTARSLNSLAALYYDQGKYAEAEPLYVRALAIREQQLGAQSCNTAHSLNGLAILYCEQGKYAEAESLMRRAISIFEQQLGVQHRDTAWSLHNLAVLYQEQGKYVEAESLMRRALEIHEHLLGTTHPDTQTVRGSYASLLRTMGRNEETKELEEEC